MEQWWKPGGLKCLPHFLLCPNFSFFFFLHHFELEESISTISALHVLVWRGFLRRDTGCRRALSLLWCLFLNSAFEPKPPNHRCSLGLFFLFPVVLRARHVAEKHRGNVWQVGQRAIMDPGGQGERSWYCLWQIIVIKIDWDVLCRVLADFRLLFGRAAPPGGILIF